MFSPDAMAVLLIANGLVPFIAFVGTLLYELHVKGYLPSCSRNTAVVVPVSVTADRHHDTGGVADRNAQDQGPPLQPPPLRPPPPSEGKVQDGDRSTPPPPRRRSHMARQGTELDLLEFRPRVEDIARLTGAKGPADARKQPEGKGADTKSGEAAGDTKTPVKT